MTQTTSTSNAQPVDNVESFTVIRTKKGNIKPRGLNQQRYVRAIQTHDVNFGIGPAGTGKTYLAVACAVEALLRDEVERILLVRPAVEAGERLGFLTRRSGSKGRSLPAPALRCTARDARL